MFNRPLSEVIKENRCVICGLFAAVHNNFSRDSYQVDCPRCRHYEIDRTALVNLHNGLDPENAAKLSGWLFDQNELGDSPFLASDSIKNILLLPRISMADKGDRLLIALIKRSPSLGSSVQLDSPDLVACIHAKETDEVRFLCNTYLASKGLVSQGDQTVRVLPKGHVYADEILHRRAATNQCFVAMWFDTSMVELYEQGFARAIEEAGYRPVRVDHVEHNRKIDDEIIAQIRRSGLLVADFTGHRGGVYFEAGFGMGLNKPVFWTCRKDDLARLHFDIRQFNFIAWEDVDDLKTRLQRRIEAVVGDGPGKSTAT